MTKFFERILANSKHNIQFICLFFVQTLTEVLLSIKWAQEKTRFLYSNYATCNMMVVLPDSGQNFTTTTTKFRKKKIKKEKEGRKSHF